MAKMKVTYDPAQRTITIGRRYEYDLADGTWYQLYQGPAFQTIAQAKQPYCRYKRSECKIPIKVRRLMLEEKKNQGIAAGGTPIPAYMQRCISQQKPAYVINALAVMQDINRKIAESYEFTETKDAHEFKAWGRQLYLLTQMLITFDGYRKIKIYNGGQFARFIKDLPPTHGIWDYVALQGEMRTADVG